MSTSRRRVAIPIFDLRRPTLSGTIAHDGQRTIGFVTFTVDMEANTGIRRIHNEDIAEAMEATADNADIMIAFASDRPAHG